MKRLLTRLWRRCCGRWWIVRRCGWPYPGGYASYLPARKTILDTGLTREAAQAACDELNGTM